ncbi:MAG: WG repeat-containing protein, partial [Saprospiraceae bacterium]
PVKIGKKYGYINVKGEVIIEPKFFSVNWFSDNRAIVETAPGRKAMINKKGNIIFQDTTGFLHIEYKDGLVRFNKNERSCFLDSLGQVRFCLPDSVSFAETAFFDERLLIRHAAGYFAYLDPQGKEVYRFRRGFPGNYHEDKVRRNFNRRTCFFNKNGRRLFCVQGPADDFNSNRALIEQKGNIYYIDNKGYPVIRQLPYDRVTAFVNGFALVEQAEKVGFIDTNGEEVIPPRYEKSLYFSSGLVAVQVAENQWIFVDEHNEQVIPQTFKAVTAPGFVGELAYVYLGGRWCYINKKGDIIWELTNEPSKE